MITRRRFLQAGATVAVGGLGFGGYALAQSGVLAVTRYKVNPKGWPPGLKLKLALIADVHACEPWIGVERIAEIVSVTDQQAPDAVLLLGDYRAGHRLSRLARPVVDKDWAQGLSKFKAPLGVHAVLGNHDWWAEPELQTLRRGPTRARLALEAAGIPVYENDAVKLNKDGAPFWIAGLGDQWAFYRPKGELLVTNRNFRHEGLDDLPGTLAKITDNAPIVLMAHEPDIFPHVTDRVALTVSGHTHGGQVNLLGYSPAVPSAFGSRYRYGHIIEDNHHLVVSGGLGYSAVPVRVGVPPEIVIVELGAQTPQSGLS